jgi:hypothetical protein
MDTHSHANYNLGFRCCKTLPDCMFDAVVGQCK